jgi:hypothetical protein
MGEPMKRRLLIAAAAAVCSIAASSLVSTVAFAAPGGQGPYAPTTEMKKYCPSGPNVLYVTQNVVGQPDVGLAGNAWATDSYRRIISVVRVAPNTYCGATSYSGTFTSTFATSPGVTGTVFSGDAGSLYGGERTSVFTAKWRPLVPTSGSIGTVYCDAVFGCPSAIDWTSLFFQDAANYHTAWWTFTYYGGTHGSWRNQADSNLGDIVS